jgi:hypothetical protein
MRHQASLVSVQLGLCNATHVTLSWAGSRSRDNALMVALHGKGEGSAPTHFGQLVEVTSE